MYITGTANWKNDNNFYKSQNTSLLFSERIWPIYNVQRSTFEDFLNSFVCVNYSSFYKYYVLNEASLWDLLYKIRCKTNRDCRNSNCSDFYVFKSIEIKVNTMYMIELRQFQINFVVVIYPVVFIYKSWTMHVKNCLLFDKCYEKKPFHKMWEIFKNLTFTQLKSVFIVLQFK